MSVAIRTKELYDDIFRPEELDHSTVERHLEYIDNDKGEGLTNATSKYKVKADMKSKFFKPSEGFVELTLAYAIATGVITSTHLSNLPYFNRGTLSINNTRIEDVSDLQIASNVRALTENNKIYNESVLSACGFDAKKENTRDIVLVNGNKIQIPLPVLFLSTKFMPMLYGCDFEVELTRTQLNDMIHGTTGILSALYYTDVKLVLPVYKPNDETKAMIDAQIASGWEREFVYEHVITGVSNLITAVNPSTGMTISDGVPVRLYTVCVPDSVENVDTAERTTFSLSGAVLNAFNVKYDGSRVFDADVSAQSATAVGEVYRMYLDHLRRQDNLIGAPMSYNDFVTDNNIIYCTDLSSQDRSLWESNRTHDIKYEIRNNTHTNHYRIYSVCVCQAKMRLKGSKDQVYITK